MRFRWYYAVQWQRTWRSCQYWEETRFRRLNDKGPRKLEIWSKDGEGKDSISTSLCFHFLKKPTTTGLENLNLSLSASCLLPGHTKFWCSHFSRPFCEGYFQLFDYQITGKRPPSLHLGLHSLPLKWGLKREEVRDKVGWRLVVSSELSMAYIIQ